MTTATKKPKVTKQARYTNIINGLTNSPPSSNSITLAGKGYSVALLVGLLQTIVKALQKNGTTKTTYAQAVAATNALLATNKPVLTGLRAGLIAAYGTDIQGLSACGITPTTRKAQTPEEKTATLAKLRSTINAKKAAQPPQPTITVTDANGQTLDLSGNTVPAASAAPAATAAASGAAAQAAVK